MKAPMCDCIGHVALCACLCLGTASGSSFAHHSYMPMTVSETHKSLNADLLQSEAYHLPSVPPPLPRAVQR